MRALISLILVSSFFCCLGQRVPNESENIDYLVTFGKDAPPNTGDDDHVQIIFFVVPYTHK